jgi:CubicO group peptidase (beta-lactamase class C family)
MTSTGYAWDKRFDAALVAIGYKGGKPDALKPMPRVTDRWGNRGPGNLMTTVGDLYKWLQSLDKNKVLSEQAKKKMFTAYAHGDEGYGWHVVKTERNTTMVHRGGGREDFESQVQWYIDEKTAVIFTVNNDLNFRRRIVPVIEQAIGRK